MKAAIGAGALAVLVLLVLATGPRARPPDGSPAAATPSSIPAEREARPGFLYGRIATVDGVTYEGRLRWGGAEEAFWGDYFNGARSGNPWIAHAPPPERRPIEILGIEMPRRIFGFEIDREPTGRRRLFMARFGDIARIEARGGDVRVTLKSGTVFDLDRMEASDFDDGLRVWDGARGAVDLDSLRIRRVDFLPTPLLRGAPDRLHGTVRTRRGDFAGFVQWDRQDCVGSDELVGRAADGELRLRYDTIRSIARRPPDGSLVTLTDGRGIVLSGSREVGPGHRGIYVDDGRYGRVLVSWDAFDRIDFSPGGSGPAYGDFPEGRPLAGRVTTRAGRRLGGRLVYDLDESETTETLDAPFQGVDYTIPFGLIASIVIPGRTDSGAQPATVTLHHGEELPLERAGDLGEANAGLLVFVEGAGRPEYVPWTDVAQVDFDRPPAMYPPIGAR